MSCAHECVSSGVKLGQVKNLMNFCKTSKWENRKVRKVAKSTRKPRITKAVLLQVFFHLLKHWNVGGFQITHQSQNFLTFFQRFCQKFLSKELRDRPSLSATGQEQPSQLMVYEKPWGWSHLKHQAVHTVGVFLTKQVWPKSLLAWLLFGWRRERRQKLSQQRDSDGDHCPAFLILSR